MGLFSNDVWVGFLSDRQKYLADEVTMAEEKKQPKPPKAEDEEKPEYVCGGW